MTCDDIVKSLRAECETCSENSICRNGMNLAGLCCANSDAADLIENQQNHIRALLQANDALRPAWIPVTERLPEDGQDVLCWYEYFRYGDYNAMFATYGIGYQYFGNWGGEVSHGTNARVLAWMPLPEPPKED